MPNAFGFKGTGAALHLKVDGKENVSDLGAAFEGRLSEVVEERLHELKAAYQTAARRLGSRYLARLRSDVAAGGFYKANRLANVWHGGAQPKVPTLAPAIFFRSKAKDIIETFSLGATITAGGHAYLAIPEGPAKAIVRRMNESVRRSPSGSGFGRNEFGKYTALGSPVDRVAQELGVRLIPIIDHASGHGVLVADDGTRLTKRGVRTKRQTGKPTVLFALVRQATLRKRINSLAILEEIKAAFPGDFTAELAATLGGEK